MTSTVVVMPTYDEAGSIVEAIDRILAETTSDVLVVDDSSPDGTGELVRRHPAYGQRVHLVTRSVKDGLGGAYRAGFRWAIEHGYRAIAQMDADLSHPAGQLPAMFALSVAGGQGGTADVVIGSRYVAGGRTENWPWLRQFISRGGNLYVRMVLGIGVRDATAGFRVYTPEALAAIDVFNSASSGYSFQVENTWRSARAGLRIAEHPITFTERLIGESKMTQRIVVEAMTRVLGWRIAELRARFRRR